MTPEQVTPELAREALDWWGRGIFDHGAAQEALRIVSDMRVEYAVQDTYTGLYVREKDDGQLGGAAEPSDADWWQDAQACADYVKFLNENPKQTVRMVSRLVSEVAE